MAFLALLGRSRMKNQELLAHFWEREAEKLLVWGSTRHWGLLEQSALALPFTPALLSASG